MKQGRFIIEGKQGQYRNQLKSLLGIETYRANAVASSLACSNRNQLKSLLGIETFKASLTGNALNIAIN